MSSEVKNSAMVTGAILSGSFFAYLLQFFLGRMLTVADFGTFNALLSITAVVGVPASVFGTSLIKKTADLHSKNEHDKVRALFWHSIIWSIALGIIFFGLFSIFKDDIFGYLKVTDANLILAFTFYMGLSFVWTVPYYFLQGLLKYFWFSVVVVMSNVLRFIVPLLILFTGRNVFNVFLGIIIGLTISFFISMLIIKKDAFPYSDVSVKADLLFMLKFSIPVMFVNLCLISFNNSDLILVRSLYDEHTAGLYAGVITIGKILLFGSTPVATVMYPKVASAISKGYSREELLRLIKKFAAIQLAVVFAGLLVFSVFPKIISLIFFGKKYLESVQYLPLYALMMFIYVLVNFLILFLLAVNRTGFNQFLIALAFAQIIAISRLHTTLYSVLYINLIVLVLGFAGLLFDAWWFFRVNDLSQKENASR